MVSLCVFYESVTGTASTANMQIRIFYELGFPNKWPSGAWGNWPMKGFLSCIEPAESLQALSSKLDILRHGLDDDLVLLRKS